MKKAFILTICLLSLQTVFSQFTIGAHTGFDINTVSIGGVPDAVSDQSSFRTAARVGLHGQINLSNTSALKTEINYVNKGLRADQHLFNIGQQLPVSTSLDASLHYIEIPVMYKHSFPLANINAFVEGGPSVMYGLNGRIEPQVNVLFDFKLPGYSINFSDETFNRVNYNMNIGAGIEMPMDDRLFLMANVRYSGGLNDLITVPIVNVETKSHTVHAGIGISYQL